MGAGLCHTNGRCGHALLEEQASDRAKIVEQARAPGQVVLESLEVVDGYEQGVTTPILLPVRLAIDIGSNLGLGYSKCARKQLQVLMGAFDVVEGRSGVFAHGWYPIRLINVVVEWTLALRFAVFGYNEIRTGGK